MARSVNDRLQDETIAHGLYVTRYGTGVARRMVSLLNRLDADLAAKLLVLLDGKRADTYSARRLASLLAGVHDLNQQAYEPVNDALARDAGTNLVGALEGGNGALRIARLAHYREGADAVADICSRACARQLRVTSRHIGARGQHASTGRGGHIAGRGSRSARIAKAAFGHGLRASYRLCVVGELRHAIGADSADNLAAGGALAYPGFQVRAAACCGRRQAV